MNYLQAAERLRQLSCAAMEPWKEIHSLVLEVDQCHNRIGGLGIKTHSLQLHDAILKAAKSFLDDYDRPDDNQSEGVSV